MMKLKDEADILVSENAKSFVTHLENIFALKRNCALARARQCADNVKQRAFARPRRSHDGNNFSR